MAKWIDIRFSSPILFLFLMYNTIFVNQIRGLESIDFFGFQGSGYILNMLAFVITYFIVCFFYGHCVKSLSVLSLSDTVIECLFVWAFYVIIKNIKATNDMEKAKDEVKKLSVEVMEALAHTIDAKDEYTRGHSVRVAKYSRMIAERLNLNDEECENVYYMALLHDIGKIGVPNEIINSTSKLTDEEYAVFKTHPGVGYDILAEIKSRPDLSIGARWHHERFDGKGYPDGKKGEEIPFFARIIAVADSYDAMTSNRSYRKYMPQDEVRSEIEKNIGTQFDPDAAKCIYLLGGSYKAAAKAAGLPLKHSGVKHILQNKKNLGNENYPAIIDKETFDAAEEERLRREAALGRDKNKGKPRPRATYYVGFSVPEVPRKYMDPVRQAEFAYGLVRNEVIR